MSSPALDAIGRYQLIQRIGAGGMAEVLLAQARGEAGFVRSVVVKRLLPELAAQSEQVEAFLEEARLLAGLTHANIVQVIDLGTDPGTGAPFMVLEHLRGRDLRAMLSSPELAGRPLPAPQAVAIARGIAAALEHVHARDILHRDISPHNVFLTVDGEVKLLDFGIARHAHRLHTTRAGTIKGKFGYMSPEQCKGEPLSAASDLFALGVVLYECSTGRRAFAGDGEVQVLYATLKGRVARPREVCEGYPPALEELVMRLMARQPQERPVSATAVSAELAALASGAGWRIEPADLAALAEPRPPAETAAASPPTSPRAEANTPATPAPATPAPVTRTASAIAPPPPTPTPTRRRWRWLALAAAAAATAAVATRLRSPTPASDDDAAATPAVVTPAIVMPGGPARGDGAPAISPSARAAESAAARPAEDAAGSAAPPPAVSAGAPVRRRAPTGAATRPGPRASATSGRSGGAGPAASAPLPADSPATPAEPAAAATAPRPLPAPRPIMPDPRDVKLD